MRAKVTFDDCFFILHVVYTDYEESLKLPAAEARQRFKDLVSGFAGRWTLGILYIELLDNRNKTYQRFYPNCYVD